MSSIRIRCHSLLAMARAMAICVVLIAAAFGSASAQGVVARTPVLIRVSVADSASLPVASAEVLVRQGLRTLGASRTGPAGTASMTISDDSTVFEIVARQIGSRPTSRFVRVSPGDTLSISLTLNRSVQSLETVRVTERESAQRRHYFLDAETIAASTRPIRSSLDAIVALRPRMLTSIGGRRVCGTVKEVWINGERIGQNFVPSPMVIHRFLPGVNPRAPVSPQVLTILDSVRPEHIAELSFIDCFGGTVRRIGSEMAVYIVLKLGVEYRWPVGTFVVGDTAP